jgi:hypothetical protein
MRRETAFVHIFSAEFHVGWQGTGECKPVFISEADEHQDNRNV